MLFKWNVPYLATIAYSEDRFSQCSLTHCNSALFSSFVKQWNSPSIFQRPILTCRLYRVFFKVEFVTYRCCYTVGTMKEGSSVQSKVNRFSEFLACFLHFFKKDDQLNFKYLMNDIFFRSCVGYIIFIFFVSVLSFSFLCCYGMLKDCSRFSS